MNAQLNTTKKNIFSQNVRNSRNTFVQYFDERADYFEKQAQIWREMAITTADKNIREFAQEKARGFDMKAADHATEAQYVATMDRNAFVAYYNNSLPFETRYTLVA